MRLNLKSSGRAADPPAFPQKCPVSVRLCPVHGEAGARQYARMFEATPLSKAVGLAGESAGGQGCGLPGSRLQPVISHSE